MSGCTRTFITRAGSTARNSAGAMPAVPGRSRHLSVAGTGSSFRADLLWLRINLAIEAVMAGASWTEAAHEAGFADSAHLTRTPKRVFGIEPSAVRPQNPRPPPAATPAPPPHSPR